MRTNWRGKLLSSVHNSLLYRQMGRTRSVEVSWWIWLWKSVPRNKNSAHSPPSSCSHFNYSSTAKDHQSIRMGRKWIPPLWHSASRDEIPSFSALDSATESLCVLDVLGFNHHEDKMLLEGRFQRRDDINGSKTGCITSAGEWRSMVVATHSEGRLWWTLEDLFQGLDSRSFSNIGCCGLLQTELLPGLTQRRL